jgi:hypothetical protein
MRTVFNANGWSFGAEAAYFGAYAIFSLANFRYSYFGGVSWGKEEEDSY